MNNCGIYVIKGPEGKLYIGSSQEIDQRWYQHRYLLTNDKHHSDYLQNAWNLHGEQAFQFEVLEECSIEELIKREQYWIDLHKCVVPNGYNMLPNAGSNTGWRHTEEAKLKISEASKNRIVSEEVREKHRQRLLEHPMSLEGRQKQAEAIRGRSHSEEHKEAISDGLNKAYSSGNRKPYWTGQSISEEHKLKISRTMSGRVLSEEHKEKLRKPKKCQLNK